MKNSLFSYIRFLRLADVLLFLLVILPPLILYTLGWSCERLDESVGAVNCLLFGLTDPAINLAFSYLILFSFGGFFFIVPIILVVHTWSLRRYFLLMKKDEIPKLHFLLSAPILALGVILLVLGMLGLKPMIMYLAVLLFLTGALHFIIVAITTKSPNAI